ncbi:MAG: cytochrome c [Bauldia sp.]|nr:cytochrome c [Bauldia sp.]
MRKGILVSGVAVGMILAAGWAVAQGTPAAEPAPAAAEIAPEVMTTGGSLFRSNCGVCHGSQGQGAAGPQLAGDAFLARADAVAGQIIRGSDYMPGFPRLADDQVAAIATYIRNSFGNSFGVVTAAEVAAVR